MNISFSVLKEYSKDKEYIDIVYDILTNENFKSMDKYMQHGNTSTKLHSINVSYLSYKICKRFKLNYKAAARSGLLHDYYLYDWHTHYEKTGLRFHGFTHPKTALKNALNEFTLSNLEQNIILRHMWPLTIIPPKNLEGLVVTFVDKYCSILETCNLLIKNLYKTQDLFKKVKQDK